MHSLRYATDKVRLQIEMPLLPNALQLRIQVYWIYRPLTSETIVLRNAAYAYTCTSCCRSKLTYLRLATCLEALIVSNPVPLTPG